jgi:diguanylate cyclase (GGDEF)-like protein
MRRREKLGDRVDVPAATLEALMDAAAAVLAADSLDDTFGRITARLGELVPFDDLVVYEVDPSRTRLGAVFADGRWIAEVMAESFGIDEGITGHTLREGKTSNVARSDLHPASRVVSGTEQEPEALVCVPMLIERETIGALNVYRSGEDVGFSAQEARVIERFGAMAALAFNSARQRELLREQARTDSLTGMLNRRAYFERITEELARGKRTDSPISVVLLDIDHFKPVNDEYGHAEGDRALQAIAQRLQATVRTDETVARYGGEEFALIAAGVGSSAAVELAERARAAVAAVDVKGVALSASAGVSTWPADGDTADRLLEAADRALYAAKHAGRGRTCVASGEA